MANTNNDPFADIPMRTSQPSRQQGGLAQNSAPQRKKTAQPQASRQAPRPRPSAAPKAPPTYRDVQSQPKLRINSEQQQAKTPDPVEKEPGRIRMYFATRTGGEVINDILGWLNKHFYVMIFLAVVFVAVGIFINRYISFGAAIAFLLLGIAMYRPESSEVSDFEVGGYIAFGCAALTFIVPYLF